MSNNLISPTDNSEKVCWGENILGDYIECEDLEDPYGYYKALGYNKMSSDEDIGVALKKAKKVFFGLGRTWKFQQQNLHCVEELVLRGASRNEKNCPSAGSHPPVRSCQINGK